MITDQMYVYRTFPPNDIEDRLNEAHARGWELHTFSDEGDDNWPSALFRWGGMFGKQITPFEEEEETE